MRANDSDGLVVDGLLLSASPDSASADSATPGATPWAFRVQPGHRVGLRGLSGKDASQLLSVLAGRSEPGAGRVQLDGTPVIADLSPGRIGYVSYAHRLVGTLTAAENVVAMLLGRSSESSPEIWRRAEQQLAALDLPAASWHNLVEQLSGGQQQRVGLARALVASPRLLVLDDPTSELDPDSAWLVGEVLDRVCADGSCCILTSTDPALLASCSVQLRLGPAAPAAPA